jgi:hypothetical protein
MEGCIPMEYTCIPCFLEYHVDRGVQNLSLRFLTEHHALKAYWRVEIYILDLGTILR